MSQLITVLYVMAALTGAAFALVELRLLVRFLRNRKAIRKTVRSGAGARVAAGAGRAAPDGPPTVTIQIPLYNERTSAEAVIRAAAGQDYPRERFDIQVLDDSTDETSSIVAQVVESVRAEGVRIEHIRREERVGYKAGALAEGLGRSDAEFVAVFDADFTPHARFLSRLLVEEVAFDEDDVAFVQTRWAWSEKERGPFQSALALLLDRHFYIQKPTRAFLGDVTTFNGSGGIWRRAAIDAAGGWSADTLTEDLDLSYRCALKGWRGRYLHDVAVESELPGHMRAFKLQQRRWARGNAQCFRKLYRKVMGSQGMIRDRWEEAFLLAGYAIHPILVANLVLWPWAVLYVDRAFFWVMQGLMSLVTLVAPLSFLLTLRERGERLSLSSVGHLLAGLCVGIGLMVNNTVGQVVGFVAGKGEFTRTPKKVRSPSDGTLRALGADRPYTLGLDWTVFLEMSLVGYAAFGAGLLVSRGEALWALPLLFWGMCLALVVQLQVRPLPA
jgi:cellulose synthase/poly-beta-1,6-N-acetylglucosamine synthase-like glycosyltransferase